VAAKTPDGGLLKPEHRVTSTYRAAARLRECNKALGDVRATAWASLLRLRAATPQLEPAQGHAEAYTLRVREGRPRRRLTGGAVLADVALASPWRRWREERTVVNNSTKAGESATTDKKDGQGWPGSAEVQVGGRWAAAK